MTQKVLACTTTGSTSALIEIVAIFNAMSFKHSYLNTI